LTNGFKFYSVHNTVINHVAGMVDSELENKPVAQARMYQHDFLKSGKLDVKTLYDRTAQNRPDVDAADVFESFGYKLQDIREPDLAIKVFEEVTLRHPQSISAHENLGYANLGQGNMKAALASFERALELDPDNTKTQKMIKGIRERM